MISTAPRTLASARRARTFTFAPAISPAGPEALNVRWFKLAAVSTMASIYWFSVGEDLIRAHVTKGEERVLYMT